jgi:hypothetical protein
VLTRRGESEFTSAGKPEGAAKIYGRGLEVNVIAPRSLAGQIQIFGLRAGIYFLQNSLTSMAFGDSLCINKRRGV